MNNEKIICAITGPTYVGKTTLSNKLVTNCGFLLPKQTTTRKQRIDDAVENYRYVDIYDFEKLKEDNRFLLYSGGGNLSYGILKEDVEEIFIKNSNLLLNISYENIEQYRLLKYKKVLLTLAFRNIKEGIINRASLKTRDLDGSEVIKRIKISEYLHKMYFDDVSTLSDAIIYTEELDEEQTFQLARKIISKKFEKQIEL